MAKDKALYLRIDTLTELLLAHLTETQELNKSEMVRKAIYHYSLYNMSDEEFTNIVQLASDCDRL